MISNNAKGIISIIAHEHQKIVKERLEPGFIRQDQTMGCLLEQLKLNARENIDMKIFLETLSHVPPEEDEDPNVSWAEDKREARQHTVNKSTGESKGIGPGSKPIEDDVHWPTPGERIC